MEGPQASIAAIFRQSAGYVLYIDIQNSLKMCSTLINCFQRDLQIIIESRRKLFSFINSREAIPKAIIGLLLDFLFRRQDSCYDHMTSQPLQIWFLFIRLYDFN